MDLKPKKLENAFQKNYRGWVYIYCTIQNGCIRAGCIPNGVYYPYFPKGHSYFSGKVVARFYCDNVEEIKKCERHNPELLHQSCLNANEFYDYLTKGKNFLGQVLGYTIHISNLEIFDKPKELSEFRQKWYCKGLKEYMFHPIEKAPQNLMYIETE